MDRTRSKRVMWALVGLVAALLAVADLTQPGSVLRAAWRSVSPQPTTPAEEMIRGIRENPEAIRR